MLKIMNIAPARYAKNCLSIQVTDDHGGWKGRQSRLCCAAGCKYSHREKRYIASKSKVEVIKKMYDNGWDATYVTNEFETPSGEIIPTYKEAKKILNAV